MPLVFHPESELNMVLLHYTSHGHAVSDRMVRDSGHHFEFYLGTKVTLEAVKP